MKRIIVSLMTSLTLLSGISALLPAEAHDYYYDHHHYYNDYYRGGGILGYHPYIQKALIGGGIGALAGGVLGSPGERGETAVKGAVGGAAVGTGYEFLKRQGMFGGYHGW